jgi:hypothetical protein
MLLSVQGSSAIRSFFAEANNRFKRKPICVKSPSNISTVIIPFSLSSLTMLSTFIVFN